MPSDPFDDLLSLEDDFYQEGFDAGITDGEHAGLVEGKVFGIEKGYEKAVELGKLHGRATVWQLRQSRAWNQTQKSDETHASLLATELDKSRLPLNNRVTKNIESLLSLSDDSSIKYDNSDEAVTDFDDRIAKAQAKAKVIAAVIGEPLKFDSAGGTTSGIEESFGLNARQ